MTDLRVFSYLPNPRIWNAMIAVRLCGVDAERANSSEPIAGRFGFAGTLQKTAASLDTHLARLRAHPAFAPGLEPYVSKLEASAR